MRLFLPAAFAGFGSLMALIAPTPQGSVKLAEPTYTQNVGPLLNARCVTCHREGGGAPFCLDSYAQAKKWSAMNLQVIGNRRMPPWKPSEKGIFHDENRLTTEEIGLLKAWDKAGSPVGPAPASADDHDDLPVETESKPDKVLQAEKPYVVMAGSEEEYRYFVVRNPYNETKWLNRVDLKPSNPRVVHHMTAFIDSTGTAERLASANHTSQAGYTSKNGGKFCPSAILGFWAPGMQGRALPEGTAIELPPRTSIVLQVHYVSTGKSETDRWSLGLNFADAPPAHPLTTGLIESKKLDIPAGAKAYEASEEEVAPADVTLWGLMPHAHKLARKMAAEAILPNGTRRQLISIEDWDPAWQSLYWFKDAIHLPKGTRIRFTVTYDNSDANPRNPSQPPHKVNWGEASDSEMLLLAFLFTRD